MLVERLMQMMPMVPALPKDVPIKVEIMAQSKKSAKSIMAGLHKGKA